MSEHIDEDAELVLKHIGDLTWFSLKATAKDLAPSSDSSLYETLRLFNVWIYRWWHGVQKHGWPYLINFQGISQIFSALRPKAIRTYIESTECLNRSITMSVRWQSTPITLLYSFWAYQPNIVFLQDRHSCKVSREYWLSEYIGESQIVSKYILDISLDSLWVHQPSM